MTKGGIKNQVLAMSPPSEAHRFTAAYRSWLACGCPPLPPHHQYSPFSYATISLSPCFTLPMFLTI